MGSIFAPVRSDKGTSWWLVYTLIRNHAGKAIFRTPSAPLDLFVMDGVYCLWLLGKPSEQEEMLKR
jgi:hypothetical protein